jgi:hypothetical protein
MPVIRGISAGEESKGTPTAVSHDEIADLESRVNALAELLQEANQERGRKLGPTLAHQAVREALRIQERVYRLIPATGVLPNELELPMGVLPDDISLVDRPLSGQIHTVTRRLPDRLVPQKGNLGADVTPEVRRMPDELTSRVASIYGQYNSLLRETGLGKAIRTASVVRWTESFGP